MKIVLDKISLQRDSLSVGEFIFMLTISEQLDLEEAKKSLLARGLIDKNYNPAERYPFKLTPQGVGIYNFAIANAESYENNEESSIEELAIALKALYPTGKKDGTSYYWTDGVALIIRRLKLFFKKYGRDYTNDQIINATRTYVDSFNGNYRYMKLLKYFILKEKRGAAGDIEGESDLLTYIENEGQIEEHNDNWASVLK